MSRIRYIKPGFFENEDLAECSPLARLLYAGLWCWAGREGRLEDRPRRLKVQILPYDDCDLDALLTELAQNRFIQRYEQDGERYLAILHFRDHQKPHGHEPESSIPPPPAIDDSTHFVPTEPDIDRIDSDIVRRTPDIVRSDAARPDGQNGESAPYIRREPDIVGTEPDIVNTSRTGIGIGTGNRNGKRNGKGVRGEGASAPVVVPSSAVDPRVFEVLDILCQPRSPNNVKYVGLKILEHSALNPVAAALETKTHIDTSRKQYKKPLVTWSNWLKNDEKPPPWEKNAPSPSNGAAPNGSPSLTPEQIAELEDPDHTGRRRTGFWPIPRGTPAPASTVSEWHDAMQWIIDQGRCDRRDLEDSLCRVTPLPPRDGFLPLRLPPESHVINQVKLGLDEQIRSALQKPGLRPHYFVEGERDG